MKTSHIEILAPAGSFESLHAAINAGADSVYLGIADFNMRATAARNFTIKDLSKIRKITKEKGVKVYITVNTVLYNDELDKMRKIVDGVKANKIDAIIAADWATIEYARSIGVEVHVSTQLSVSNTETVKFYSKYADRIVLARELSLEQVKEICNDIKDQNIRGPRGDLIEIEAFAHGALCVAVSGRCAMSLFHYGTSANRGKCAQICRRRFRVIDIESGKELEIDNNYVMSSADLCTIGLLPLLVDAGVKVLKIEGRGRPAEYVDTVVSTYKKALQAIEDGTFDVTKIDKWNSELKTVFNRGQSTGLYMGREFNEWAGTHGSKSTTEKLLIGQVTNYYGKIKVVEIKIDADDIVKDGEDFFITGETTGLVKGKLKDMLHDEKRIKTAKKGDIITMKIDSKVRKKDKFFIVRKRKSYIPRGKEKFFDANKK